MRLAEIERHYRIGYRHNPKHFYANSFSVEFEARRLVLIGVVKRRVKRRFRVVGILKVR